MRNLITAGFAAATLVGGLAATAPASARPWHGGYYHRGDDDVGAAVAGGIVGLALGAAITSGHGGYYGPGYGPYYGPYYGPGYAMCTSRRWVWDPYVGRYVVRHIRYAC